MATKIWTSAGASINLSNNDQTATMMVSNQGAMVTTANVMTAGEHVIELRIDEYSEESDLQIGVVKQNLNHDEELGPTDGFTLSLWTTILFGEDSLDSYNMDSYDKFVKGDHIKCVLDLDQGHLKFFRNDTQLGPGFTQGVTGPVVWGIELNNENDSVSFM